MHWVSSQDSTVEIAFIPGKGLFPSSASLHNGVQRAAGNSYNSGRLKVHIRSPEVSTTIGHSSAHSVWIPLCFLIVEKVEAAVKGNEKPIIFSWSCIRLLTLGCTVYILYIYYLFTPLVSMWNIITQQNNSGYHIGISGLSSILQFFFQFLFPHD